MNAIELAEKNLVSFVKEKMEELKKVEDEAVQKVVTELEVAVSEYDVLNKPTSEEEPSIEEPKTPEADGDKPSDPKKEPADPEEVPKPEVEIVPPSKPVVPEPTIVADGAVASEELSMKVAEKLEEAALELDNKDKELVAKTEIITGFKNKVVELQANNTKLNSELAHYKQQEQLELTKQKKENVSILIELYKNLGIAKTATELEQFTTVQLLELKSALEITAEKKNTLVRQTPKVVKPVVQREEKSIMNDEVVFEGLFGTSMDDY